MHVLKAGASSDDDDEKAEENDNRKIVPSGRRLRSHRTMSALSVLRSGGTQRHDVANAWTNRPVIRLLPLRSPLLINPI